MRAHSVALLCLSIVALPLGAQVNTPTPVAPRTTTVVAGLGNTLGWFGGRAERHLGGERWSVLVGVGVTPSLDDGAEAKLTFAAGARRYTAGRRHRGFLEASVSQIAIEERWNFDADAIDRNALYGPGLQVGYQYSALSGFTIDLSGGLGYAIDHDTEFSAVYGIFGIALGYTFR